jgi:hypothetical protein
VREGLRKGDLVGKMPLATHAAALKAMHPNTYNQNRNCLACFIDVLVAAGVADLTLPLGGSPL